MSHKLILKKNIETLLSKASLEFNVYFPTQDKSGDCRFVSLLSEKKALTRLRLDYDNLVVPPKSIFFPQLEEMFTFKKGRLHEVIESSPKLIFGIRACDLKGLRFCDEFFRRNFQDKYYLSRIKNRLTVLVGCVRPPRKNKCFCTSSNTGPFLEDGYDLQFTDLEESFFVETGSKQGEDFIKKYKKFFKNADKKDILASKKMKKSASCAIELNVDFFKAIECLNTQGLPLENYRRIAERCIYCGGCLYVCPTCTCFNVFDYRNRRLRNWDTCVFEGYTREASGHNPRKDKAMRTARRYEHKLIHDYNTVGMSGCVGCGRCLDSCPVNIGISKFIQEITENKELM